MVKKGDRGLDRSARLAVTISGMIGLNQISGSIYREINGIYLLTHGLLAEPPNCLIDIQVVPDW